MKRDGRRMLGFVVLLVLLGVCSNASATNVAVDAVASAKTNGSSVTFSLTVGSGSNRLMVVGVSVKGNHKVSSVTYGGVNLTDVSRDQNAGWAEVWRLVAPASGTANVVVTIASSGDFVAGAVSFTGVDQGAPLGSVVFAEGNSTAPSVTVSSRTGDMVLDVLMGQGTTASAEGSQTERWNLLQSDREGGSTKPGASSVTMSWTTGSAKWVLYAVNVRHVGTADGSVVSGRYTGNATDDTVISAQLGFEPAVVFVKGDTAQEGVIRTATMDTDLTKPLGSATALTANMIQSLNGISGLSQGGITVGTDARVNSNAVTYYWTAFSPKAGQMFVGSYMGDGNDDRSITGVGFQPDIVMVFADDVQDAVWRTSTMAGDNSLEFTSTSAASDVIQAMESGGFQVGTDARVNGSGIAFHYIAWKQTTGAVKVSSYAGNSADNRNITAVGFQPEFVMLRSTTNVASTRWKSGATDAATDLSCYSGGAAACVADAIQALQSDGFQVGTSNVNVTGNTYYYAAFARSQTNTAVGLASFSATPTDRGRTLLKWRTGYEADNLGFHVYREERGVRTRLTPSLVGGSGLMVALGTRTTAALSYQWLDREAIAPDAEVSYWLEDVDLNGTRTLHGPIVPVTGISKSSDAAPSLLLQRLAKPTDQKSTVEASDLARVR